MKIKEIFFEIDGKSYSIVIANGLNKGFLLRKDGKDQPLEYGFNITIKEWTFKDTLTELKSDWQLIRMKIGDWLKTRKRWGYRQYMETSTSPKLDMIVKEKDGKTTRYTKRQFY